MNIQADENKFCVDNRKNKGGESDFQVFNPNNGTTDSFTGRGLDKTRTKISAEFQGGTIQKIGLNAGKSGLISHIKI